MVLILPAPIIVLLATAVRVSTPLTSALVSILSGLLPSPLPMQAGDENETATDGSGDDVDSGAQFGGGEDNESESDVGGDGSDEATDGGSDLDIDVGGAGNESAAGNETDATGGGSGSDGGGGGGMSATQGPRDAGGDGGGLFGFDVGEYVSEMFTEVGDQAAESFADLIEVMVQLIVGTPAPNAIIGAPTNEPWATAYEYYMGDVMTIALLLFVAVIASIAAAGTVSGVLSRYQTNQLWWRAMFALIFIYFWWPLGAISLNFMDWLATLIAPDAADFTGSTEEVLMGVAGSAVVAASLQVISTGTVIGIAMLYGARFVALVTLLVFMPILVMLWVVDASIFTRISNLASGLASTFVPLLFLTLPAAGLMRIGVMIFQAGASADWISAPVLVFLSLGTLLAALFAAPYMFKISNQFMAESYGAERVGNMLDEQLATRKEQVAQWYSGDGGGDPTEPASPPPTVAEKKQPLNPSPTGAGASSGTAATDGGNTSRPRLSPKADRTVGGSSSSSSPSTPAPASTATGTPSPSNKYATQQRANDHRIESRRKQLNKDYDFTTGYD